jgi:hypothetical protein
LPALHVDETVRDLCAGRDVVLEAGLKRILRARGR